MKIVLVRVPTIIDASASTAPICPPVGLAYLKAICSRFSKQITVIDSVGNKPEVTRMQLGNTSFRILGESAETIAAYVPADSEIILFSIMFSQDWPYAREVLREIRKRATNAVIIAGGEHISAVPEFSMNSAPEIDVCVLGEGENTLHALLTHYQNSSALPTEIPGTCVRHPTKGFHSNVKQARITVLKEIPDPDWDGFPLDNYLDNGHGFGVNHGRSMPIVATRGCPYQCTFCSNPQMWTTAWKSREPEDVLREIKIYIAKYRATNFDFYDLTAIVKKDWIVRFCKMLIEENLNITWQLPSGTRSEAIDREVAALLYASGCRNLSYAPESGSPEILTLIKKKISVPKMLESMRGCVRERLSVKANIICGFPDETWAHLRQTLWFIVKVAATGIDDLSINQFSPYPGSELFDRLVKEGKVQLNDEYFESLSYYSSMTNARSYGNHLSNRDILIYKTLGTSLFYLTAFGLHPIRVFTTIRNAIRGVETNRLDKTLNAYLLRFRATPNASRKSIKPREDSENRPDVA